MAKLIIDPCLSWPGSTPRAWTNAQNAQSTSPSVGGSNRRSAQAAEAVRVGGVRATPGSGAANG
jgi:hypothetical protein